MLAPPHVARRRLEQLALCFGIDVYPHTVLSSHFHLVVRHDPLAWRGWSDEDVAWRWFEVFSPTDTARWCKSATRNCAN